MRTGHMSSTGLPRSEAHESIRSLLGDDPSAALHHCKEALAREPHDAETLRLMGRALRALGRDAEAQRAELAAIDMSSYDPALQESAAALLENRLEITERLLKKRLRVNPFDVAAIRMLAEVAGRLGRNNDAEKLLRRALELAPGFVAARANMATVLYRQGKMAEALEELGRLNAEDPDNPGHSNLRAAILGRIGEFDEALALYEEVLSTVDDHPKIWMSYGHALKTVGRQQDSISAYRRATALRPTFGEAWWSIANLKIARFDIADIATMKKALENVDASIEDLFHLHFALAKAVESEGRVVEAFYHYEQGNKLRRGMLPYEAVEISAAVNRMIATFDEAFFNARENVGCETPDPIFIVGLPRSGSTLIEQILSSHSLVEGTAELPDIPNLITEMDQKRSYLQILSEMVPDQLRELGESYIKRTGVQRREGKPFFIDKLPNNWLHIGFIHLILPNARIIDARRYPLDCGYSNFRQHFARGQAFSYSLSDIGHYYADYVRLMRHFDVVLPGRIYRVIHEKLLDEPEREVRRLLEAMHLPFEQACLQFYDNKRPVRTASSEQVRRPINRDGEGLWRAVSEQLAPLKAALGDLTETYADPA